MIEANQRRQLPTIYVESSPDIPFVMPVNTIEVLRHMNEWLLVGQNMTDMVSWEWHTHVNFGMIKNELKCFRSTILGHMVVTSKNQLGVQCEQLLQMNWQ